MHIVKNYSHNVKGVSDIFWVELRESEPKKIKSEFTDIRIRAQSIHNRSGLSLTLLLFNYDWYEILCYSTYDYELDFSRQIFGKNTISSSCHDTKREGPRLPPGEPGGASKMGHAQEIAH